MSFSKKNILVLTDGSQGMISQSLGLAKQISFNIFLVQTSLLFPWSKLQPGILPIFPWIFLNNLKLNIKPDLIISCGRKSVYLSLYFKKIYKNAITIHIQNPKINYKNFNYIIAPEHDGIVGENIISSIGALHKFNNNVLKEVIDENFDIPKKNLISLIIGGKNSHYKFTINEINELILKIKILKKTNPSYNILLLYSRRTTSKMKSLLSEGLKNISINLNKNQENPYIYALKYSDYFIVTSDSTSMISECAFTGKPIFVFHLPFRRNSKRIKKFHEQFNKLNITKNLKGGSDLDSWNYKPLDESKRIAGIIKERIIKEL